MSSSAASSPHDELSQGLLRHMYPSAASSQSLSPGSPELSLAQRVKVAHLERRQPADTHLHQNGNGSLHSSSEALLPSNILQLQADLELGAGETSTERKRRWEGIDKNAHLPDLDSFNAYPMSSLSGMFGLIQGRWSPLRRLYSTTVPILLLFPIMWLFINTLGEPLASEYIFSDISISLLLLCCMFTNFGFGICYIRSGHIRILLGRISALPFFCPNFHKKHVVWNKIVRQAQIWTLCVWIFGASCTLGLCYYFGQSQLAGIPLWGAVLIYVQTFMTVTLFVGIGVVMCVFITLTVYLQRAAVRQLANYFRKLQPREFCLNRCLHYYDLCMDIVKSHPNSMTLFLACLCGLTSSAAILFLKSAVSHKLAGFTFVNAFPCMFFLLVSFATLMQMGKVDSDYQKLVKFLNASLANQASRCISKDSVVTDPKALNSFIRYWGALLEYTRAQPIQYVVFGQPLTSAFVGRIVYLIGSAILIIIQSILS